MAEEKPRRTPLGSHLRLSKEKSPNKKEDKEEIAKVPDVSIVGSLMYEMVCTRLNITHVVGFVNQFMSNPGREHWERVKWLLHYLKGTFEAALCFRRKGEVLEGFCDVDLGGFMDSRKSTLWYVFTIKGTKISYNSIL